MMRMNIQKKKYPCFHDTLEISKLAIGPSKREVISSKEPYIVSNMPCCTHHDCHSLTRTHTPHAYTTRTHHMHITLATHLHTHTTRIHHTHTPLAHTTRTHYAHMQAHRPAGPHTNRNTYVLSTRS